MWSIRIRRLLQFRLRSILVAVTFLAVVFARIGYLHRMAEFHAREAEMQTAIAIENRYTLLFIEKWLPEAEQGYPHSITRRKDGAEVLGEDDFLLMISHHRRLSQEFRSAAYRPWRIVDDSLPKEVVKYHAEIRRDLVQWEQATATKYR
jgi:hypothetical protein